MCEFEESDLFDCMSLEDFMGIANRKMDRLKKDFLEKTGIEVDLFSLGGDLCKGEERHYWEAENLYILNPSISPENRKLAEAYEIVVGG